MCVRDLSPRGKGNSQLTKLFGGLSYEKIWRYNNSPPYVMARWQPQQDSPWGQVNRNKAKHSKQIQATEANHPPPIVALLAIGHPLYLLAIRRSPASHLDFMALLGSNRLKTSLTYRTFTFLVTYTISSHDPY